MKRPARRLEVLAPTPADVERVESAPALRLALMQAELAELRADIAGMRLDLNALTRRVQELDAERRRAELAEREAAEGGEP